MKSSFSPLRKAACLSLLSLFLAGCQAPNYYTGAETGARFHEASSANVVLRFTSWDYTFLVQPEFRENGYYRQLHHDEIAQTIKELNVPHDLAVVTVGWGWNPEQLKAITAEWESMLSGCGFRRVVVVRATINSEIDGALIVDDSLASNTTSRPTAAL